MVSLVGVHIKNHSGVSVLSLYFYALPSIRVSAADELQMLDFLWHFQSAQLIFIHPLCHSFLSNSHWVVYMSSNLQVGFLREVKGYESCLWLGTCQDYVERLTSCCPTYT